MTKIVRFLGMDYGSKRVGLSYGDTELLLAMPLSAIIYRAYISFCRQLKHLSISHPWDVFVVGYPLNEDGRAGSKAKEVDCFITRLEQTFALPVVRSDETLTSEEALRHLKVNVKARNLSQWRALRQTGKIDSGAAVLILQDHLNHLMVCTPELVGNSVDGNGQEFQP
jgi:putative Holliday junction resolvase